MMKSSLFLAALLMAGCAATNVPAPTTVPTVPQVVAIRIVEDNWYDMTCFVSVDNVAYGHKVCYPTISLVQSYIQAREAGLDRFVPGAMNKE
jgi:hypothetical protein